MSAIHFWGSTWGHLWHEIESSSCWCTRKSQKMALIWRRRLRKWKMISEWSKQRSGSLVATQKVICDQWTLIFFLAVKQRDAGKSYCWRRSMHWFERPLKNKRNDHRNPSIESTSALNLILVLMALHLIHAATKSEAEACFQVAPATQKMGQGTFSSLAI